jgi:hypothetical protein
MRKGINTSRLVLYSYLRLSKDREQRIAYYLVPDSRTLPGISLNTFAHAISELPHTDKSYSV